jgi:hypothetical protein
MFPTSFASKKIPVAGVCDLPDSRKDLVSSQNRETTQNDPAIAATPSATATR